MKEATCMCGWHVRGTEDDVVEQVIAHGRDAHNVETTRDEVLALIIDVRAPADERSQPA